MKTAFGVLRRPTLATTLLWEMPKHHQLLRLGKESVPFLAVRTLTDYLVGQLLRKVIRQWSLRKLEGNPVTYRIGKTLT